MSPSTLELIAAALDAHCEWGKYDCRCGEFHGTSGFVEHQAEAVLAALGKREGRIAALEAECDRYRDMARHAEEQLVAEHPEFDKWETTRRIREVEAEREAAVALLREADAALIAVTRLPWSGKDASEWWARYKCASEQRRRVFLDGVSPLPREEM